MSVKDLSELIDVCIITNKNINIDFIEDLYNKIPINKLIIEKSHPLGLARWLCIKKVETEYFAFIDDDVIIPDNWFESLSIIFDSNKIGAVYGANIIKGLGLKLEDEFRKINKYSKILKKGERFDTNNCIIRTELVKNWNYKNTPYCYEDFDIGKHIMNKNKLVIKISIETYHKKTWKKIIKSGFSAGYEWNFYFKKNRFKHIFKAIIHPFIYPFKKMLYLFVYSLVMNISFIFGIIKSFFIRRQKFE